MVIGLVEQKKVFKVVRSIIGREVCLWLCFYYFEFNGFNDKYYKKKFCKRIIMLKNGEKVSFYNYYMYGYYGYDYGYYQEWFYFGFIDENVIFMFSEENFYFCNIM